MMIKPKRKQTRLKDYDYSKAGYYFVTVCTHNMNQLFGEIVDGGVVLNKFGNIAHDEWIKSSHIRKEIHIDKFIIMPNHVHGIIAIKNNFVGAYGNTPMVSPASSNNRAYNHTPLRSPSKTLGAMIRGYKSSVTAKINKIRNTPKTPVWQRNYHDHIIRNQKDYQRIWEYINTNPQKWELDRYYIE